MQTWQETATYFEKVTDRLGQPIDHGIFDTVVALNILGIPTHQSCEGHLTHGAPYPWVDIAVIDSRERTGQPIKEKELARLQLRYRMFGYLSAFYQERRVSFDRIITLEYPIRIRSQGGEFIDLLESGERERKLRVYQEEMQAFTSFLKTFCEE